MSIFGGQSDNQTALGTQVGSSDNSLATNYHGSAPLDSTIKSETWLPGTTGVDCKLVHGDRWQEIKGAMTQHVQDTKTSTYDKEFTETYGNDVHRSMHGAVDESFCAEVTRDYYAHLDETFEQGHTQKNLHEELEFRTSKAEIMGFLFETTPLKIEMLHTGVSVGVLQMELGGVGICAHVGELQVAGWKEECEGLKETISALKSHIHTAKVVLQGLESKIMSALVHSGPTVGVNSNL